MIPLAVTDQENPFDQYASPVASEVRILHTHGEPPAILTCPERKRLFHLLDVDHISRLARGAHVSGKSDHETEILEIVRLTIRSVITRPWTVRSPLTRADPESSRFAVVGLDTQIPTLHRDVITICCVLFVRKRRSWEFVVQRKSEAPIVLPESDQKDQERAGRAFCQVARPVASEMSTLLSHGEPPAILTCPLTSSFAPGVDVPIPTFHPVLNILELAIQFVPS
jgi:hypothetical protein